MARRLGLAGLLAGSVSACNLESLVSFEESEVRVTGTITRGGLPTEGIWFTLSWEQPQCGGGISVCGWVTHERAVTDASGRYTIVGTLESAGCGTLYLTVTDGPARSFSLKRRLDRCGDHTFDYDLAATVSVQPPPPLSVGASHTFVADVRDGVGVRLTDRAVAWSSSDTLILAIDSLTGAGTARAPGTVTITARVEGLATTTQFEVVLSPALTLALAPLHHPGFS